MKRNEETFLWNWYRKPHRKPLVIRGARQVGKSTLVRLFCRDRDLQLVELNFEEDPSLKKIFSSNDPVQIVQTIEIIYNTRIDTSKTVLFLDEIQSHPEVIVTLRYFYERMPELAVISAGSLLEFALDNKELSVPVGRIEYLFLGPMTFEEFLEATEENQLLSYIQRYTFEEKIPQPIHEKALELLKTYYLLGGMPEVIKVYTDTGSLLEADAVKFSILNTYRDDFASYGSRMDVSRMQEVFDRLGSTVGKKIRYVELSEGERTAVTQKILTFFTHARILYRVYHSSADYPPLKAQIRRKISKGILVDIGLFLAMSGLSIGDIAHDSNLLLSNRGELAEQFIGQHLLYDQPSYMTPELYYWTREKPQSNAEVDFLVQRGNSILPIEVKSGKTGTLKSLHLYMESKHLQVALRFSTHTPAVETAASSLPRSDFTYTLVTLPLYLVGQSRRLMKQLPEESRQNKAPISG